MTVQQPAAKSTVLMPARKGTMMLELIGRLPSGRFFVLHPAKTKEDTMGEQEKHARKDQATGESNAGEQGERQLTGLELYKKLIREGGSISNEVEPPEGWSRVIFRR